MILPRFTHHFICYLLSILEDCAIPVGQLSYVSYLQ